MREVIVEEVIEEVEVEVGEVKDISNEGEVEVIVITIREQNQIEITFIPVLTPQREKIQKINMKVINHKNIQIKEDMNRKMKKRKESQKVWEEEKEEEEEVEVEECKEVDIMIIKIKH